MALSEISRRKPKKFQEQNLYPAHNLLNRIYIYKKGRTEKPFYDIYGLFNKLCAGFCYRQLNFIRAKRFKIQADNEKSGAS